MSASSVEPALKGAFAKEVRGGNLKGAEAIGKVIAERSIEKGIEAAKKNLIRVPLAGTTIPHMVVGKFGSGSVLMKPAPEGTGLIAGGAVRAVVESCGIHNVLTKSLGSANPHNVVRAAFTALQDLKDPVRLMRLRGKDSLADLAGGRTAQ